MSLLMRLEFHRKLIIIFMAGYLGIKNLPRIKTLYILAFLFERRHHLFASNCLFNGAISDCTWSRSHWDFGDMTPATHQDINWSDWQLKGIETGQDMKSNLWGPGIKKSLVIAYCYFLSPDSFATSHFSIVDSSCRYAAQRAPFCF